MIYSEADMPNASSVFPSKLDVLNFRLAQYNTSYNSQIQHDSSECLMEVIDKG